ncbi:hypothetical protein VNO77_42042 [Canavalia gladiata]|uniref:Uncharacterized protein n=1 Tax=Canavalia gladiata TaxID=3824 RepID=A0AAN9K2K1_CANGL
MHRVSVVLEERHACLAGAPAVHSLNGKREGEDEDERQVSAKKQKRDEFAEKQKNEEEIISDDSFTGSEPDKVFI